MTKTDEAAGTKPGRDKGERVVIQKYANRRLYNKATSTYITLDNLAEMVREGVDFVVYDAKSNEDITRKVLTQIIFDEENNSTEGKNLLPIQFLRQLISFYGDNMQGFLPSYLELSLDAFSRQQETMRAQFATGKFPVLGAPTGFLEEQVRQNMLMFERAMKMFTPFAYAKPGEAPATAAAAPAASAAPPAPAPEPAPDSSLDDLKAQIAAMQSQIEKLANSNK
jgi:polyhydroxyalkanoate synthesis repressor PhaR